MKRFCSIISCFLAITILISSSMVTAHAAAVTSPLIAPFWTWAGEKALGDATPDQGYLGAADYLKSVFSLKDSGCPSSQSKNGCHFWQLVEDLTVSVLAGKFRVKCSYCGMYYSDYSSCDPDGEAAAAYSNYVSTLPATGYSSAGALLWQPRWIEDAKTFKITLGPFVSSGTASYAISPEIDGYYQSVKACSVSTENTTILVEFTDPSSASSPNFDCHDHVFKAPINGNYRIIASPYASGKVLESSTWRDYDLSWKPLNFGGIAAGGSLRLGKATPGNKDTGSGYYSYFYLPRGGTLAFYTPVFQIVPVDTSIGNTTYNINTRVNNFNGDYYDSVTNNYYNNTTIVNETNNTYYDMSTNTTQNMTSWNYDYKSRTYFITLEDGTTVAVQFGDNELTITKNDETSNTYNYVIKNNSGGDTPDTPTTCKHNWVETIDAAPTCLEGGHASYTCSLCKETYEQVLPANGHTWTVKEHVNTVFDTDGTVLTQGHTLYECSVCGEQFYTDTGAPPPDVSGSGTVVAWLNNFQAWLDGRLNLAFNFNFDSIIDKLDVIIEGTSESVENRINVTIDASNDAHNVFYITGEDGEEQSVTEFTGDLTKASGRLLSLLYRLVFADALSTVDGDLDGFEDFYTSQGEETATQGMNAPYEEENVWLAS